MGKLYSPPGTARRQSLRGSHYVYESKAGTVISTWPQKRPGPKSEAQEASMKLFREANDALKRMSAGQQNYARENAKGTPFLPRDCLMACLYGNGPVIGLRTGEKLRPMAVRVNTSLLFDNIAWQPGSMMFRGADFWEGIPPGAANDVLVFRSNTLVPVWQANVAKGGSVVSVIGRSTDQAASSTWPKFVPWNSSLQDPLNVLRPGFPDRIYLPQAYSLVRVTASVEFTGTGSAIAYFGTTSDPMDLSNWAGSARASNSFTTTSFSNRTIYFQSAWIDPTRYEYVRIRVNATPTYSAGALQTSWAQVEAQ